MATWLSLCSFAVFVVVLIAHCHLAAATCSEMSMFSNSVSPGFQTFAWGATVDRSASTPPNAWMESVPYWTSSIRVVPSSDGSLIFRRYNCPAEEEQRSWEAPNELEFQTYGDGQAVALTIEANGCESSNDFGPICGKMQVTTSSKQWKAHRVSLPSCLQGKKISGFRFSWSSNSAPFYLAEVRRTCSCQFRQGTRQYQLTAEESLWSNGWGWTTEGGASTRRHLETNFPTFTNTRSGVFPEVLAVQPSLSGSSAIRFAPASCSRTPGYESIHLWVKTQNWNFDISLTSDCDLYSSFPQVKDSTTLCTPVVIRPSDNFAPSGAWAPIQINFDCVGDAPRFGFKITFPEPTSTVYIATMDMTCSAERWAPSANFHTPILSYPNKPLPPAPACALSYGSGSFDQETGRTFVYSRWNECGVTAGLSVFSAFDVPLSSVRVWLTMVDSASWAGSKLVATSCSGQKCNPFIATAGNMPRLGQTTEFEVSLACLDGAELSKLQWIGDKGVAVGAVTLIPKACGDAPGYSPVAELNANCYPQEQLINRFGVSEAWRVFENTTLVYTADSAHSQSDVPPNWGLDVEGGPYLPAAPYIIQRDVGQVCDSEDQGPSVLRFNTYGYRDSTWKLDIIMCDGRLVSKTITFFPHFSYYLFDIPLEGAAKSIAATWISGGIEQGVSYPISRFQITSIVVIPPTCLQLADKPVKQAAVADGSLQRKSSHLPAYAVALIVLAAVFVAAALIVVALLVLRHQHHKKMQLDYTQYTTQ